MALDYESLVTELYGEIDNQNTRVLSFIRAEIPRQLLELQTVRTVFQEDSFTFPIVAGTSEYGPGDSGFPLDALAFDTMYVETGSGTSIARHNIVGPLAIEDARFRYAYSSLGGNRPELYARHHQMVVFAPQVTAANTVKGDYFKDATRDTGGTVIDTTSTTATNGWFDRGRTALRNSVLRELFGQILEDDIKAKKHDLIALRALGSLKREWLLLKGSSLQSPRRLSQDDPTPEDYRTLVRW